MSWGPAAVPGRVGAGSRAAPAAGARAARATAASVGRSTDPTRHRSGRARLRGPPRARSRLVSAREPPGPRPAPGRHPSSTPRRRSLRVDVGGVDGGPGPAARPAGCGRDDGVAGVRGAVPDGRAGASAIAAGTAPGPRRGAWSPPRPTRQSSWACGSGDAVGVVGRANGPRLGLARFARRRLESSTPRCARRRRGSRQPGMVDDDVRSLTRSGPPPRRPDRGPGVGIRSDCAPARTPPWGASGGGATNPGCLRARVRQYGNRRPCDDGSTLRPCSPAPAGMRSWRSPARGRPRSTSPRRSRRDRRAARWRRSRRDRHCRR
jgi:hypothetical protein